jgi:hypothetical protein
MYYDKVLRNGVACTGEGDWVRIKGQTVYKGDLGKVMAVDEGARRAQVKVGACPALHLFKARSDACSLGSWRRCSGCICAV